MLAFPAAIRIFVAVQPVDMRKSFNGLWSAVSEQLGEDPKSGAVFAFINRERSRLKLLYWDGTGVWVLAKRLEHGRFSCGRERRSPEARAGTGGARPAGRRRGTEARFAQSLV